MKNCVFCDYFYFESGWCGTDVTPGDETSIGCLLDLMEIEMWTGTQELREKLATALNCDKFKAHPFAIRKGYINEKEK